MKAIDVYSEVSVSDRLLLEDELRIRRQIENVLLEITSVEIHVNNYIEIIESAMLKLGEAFDVSRIYIFQNDTTGQYISNTHEWCADGVPPQKEFLQKIKISTIQWFMEKLNNDGILNIADVAAINDTFTREMLQQQEIRSLLVLPLMKYPTMIGFIGFDECRQKRHWDERTIQFLRFISWTLGQVIIRVNEENMLWQTEQKLKNIVNNIPQAIFSIGRDGRLEYISDAVHRISGYDLQVGDDPMQLWGNMVLSIDRHIIDEGFKRLRRGQIESSEYRIRTKKNHMKWIRHVLIPVRDENNTIIRYDGLLEDITKIKDIDRMKNEFISNISHELRTPLTSIIGFVETLRTAKDISEQNTQMFLEIIAEQSHRLKELIERLLQLNRINRNALALDRKEVRLDMLASTVINELQPICDSEGHTVIAHLSPVTVSADPYMITEVIENLMTNAIKFTPREGRITITVTETDTAGCIIVQDTGQGISPKHLPHIFERFYRAHVAHDEIQGTGLGLYITKSYVDLHDGTIETSSTIGVGTTIKVLLKKRKEKAA